MKNARSIIIDTDIDMYKRPIEELCIISSNSLEKKNVFKQ